MHLHVKRTIAVPLFGGRFLCTMAGNEVRMRVCVCVYACVCVCVCEGSGVPCPITPMSRPSPRAVCGDGWKVQLQQRKISTYISLLLSCPFKHISVTQRSYPSTCTPYTATACISRHPHPRFPSPGSDIGT